MTAFNPVKFWFPCYVKPWYWPGCRQGAKKWVNDVRAEPRYTAHGGELWARDGAGNRLLLLTMPNNERMMRLLLTGWCPPIYFWSN